MIIGYARVSTQGKNPDFQFDALEEARCNQMFQEKFTRKLWKRPELLQCLITLRKGDILRSGGLETGPAGPLTERFG